MKLPTKIGTLKRTLKSRKRLDGYRIAYGEVTDTLLCVCAFDDNDNIFAQRCYNLSYDNAALNKEIKKSALHYYNILSMLLESKLLEKDTVELMAQKID